MNRKDIRIWLSLLAGCASIWILKTAAWPLTEIENAEAFYYLQSVKGVRLGGPLVTFDTYTCDQNLWATTASFTDHNRISSTSYEMLPIPESPVHRVHKYTRKAQTTYLILPGNESANWVCDNEPQKMMFMKKVVFSKRLEDIDKKITEVKEKKELSYIDVLGDWFQHYGRRPEDDLAQIFTNLKMGKSLEIIEADSMNTDKSDIDDGPIFSRGRNKRDDSSGAFGYPSKPDDEGIHSLAHQIRLSEIIFGDSYWSGYISDEWLMAGQLKKKKTANAAENAIRILISAVPSSSGNTESGHNESSEIQVTANTAEENLNIIQFGLSLGNIPLTDNLHEQLLNISEMSAAELENLATIFENLAVNAPALIEENIVLSTDLDLEKVVQCLLRIEYLINKLRNARLRSDRDEYETPSLATIRSNLRMSIGASLAEQVLGTQQAIVRGGTQLQQSALVNALLGYAPPLTPPEPDNLVETIDELTTEIEAGEVSPENIERLKTRITRIRQMIEQISTNLIDAELEKWQKLINNLDDLQEALVRFEQVSGAELTESSAPLLDRKKQVNYLERQVARLDRSVQGKKQNLEEAVPGSAWAQTLQARIENLTEQRDQAARELLEMMTNRPQQQSPDASPEPSDMETDASQKGTQKGIQKGIQKGRTTSNQSMKKKKESNSGTGDDRGDGGEDEGDSDRRRDDDRRRGRRLSEGANQVQLATNPTQRSKEELVMWVAKNLESMNRGGESKARGFEHLTQEMFKQIVEGDGAADKLKELILAFLRESYPADAERLLRDASIPLESELLEAPGDIAPYIRVMMHIKRTLRLSRMLLTEGIVEQSKLEQVKKQFQLVLGQTAKQVEMIRFVTADGWALSAVHNGVDLLKEDSLEVQLLRRIRETSFATLTDPVQESPREFSEPDALSSGWAAFMRDASRSPFTLSYVGGATTGQVFRVFRDYLLFDAKGQDADLKQRFPQNPGLVQISLEGGVGDTAELFFSEHPKVVALLSRLINQDTLNSMKSMIFGGTGGALGGGFSESEGILTQLGLQQMHGMNRVHDDPEASNVRVTVYSNGKLRVVYKVMFDQWSPLRNPRPVDRLEGRFEMEIIMEFDTKGPLRRTYAGFRYKGQVEQPELEKAAVQVAQKEEKKRVDEVGRLEKKLSGLLSSQKYKPKKTGAGQTFTALNTWQILDAFEAVPFDPDHPETWYYHPDVIAITEVFRSCADVLKQIERLDYRLHKKYKSHRKSLNKLQERFQTLFSSYIQHHHQAYRVLLGRRGAATESRALDEVFDRLSVYQTQLLDMGSVVAQMESDLSLGVHSSMNELLSMRSTLEEYIQSYDTQFERIQTHDGDLSLAKSRVLNNKEFGLAGDELDLITKHIPIIVRGLQVEALLGIQKAKQSIVEQEIYDLIRRNEQVREADYQKLLDKQAEMQENTHTIAEMLEGSYDYLDRSRTKRRASEDQTSSHQVIGYGSTLRRGTASSTPNLHNINKQTRSERGTSKHQEQGSNDSKYSWKQSFLSSVTLGIYGRYKKSKKKSPLSESFTFIDKPGSNQVSSEIEVVGAGDWIRHQDRKKSRSQNDLLAGTQKLGLNGVPVADDHTHSHLQPVEPRRHRLFQRWNPNQCAQSSHTGLMVVQPPHKDRTRQDLRLAQSHERIEQMRNEALFNNLFRSDASDESSLDFSARLSTTTTSYFPSSGIESSLSSGSRLSSPSHSHQGSSSSYLHSHSHASSMGSFNSLLEGQNQPPMALGRQISWDGQNANARRWQNPMDSIPASPHEDQASTFGVSSDRLGAGRRLARSQPALATNRVVASCQVGQLSASLKGMINSGYPSGDLVGAVLQLIQHHRMTVRQFAQHFVPPARGAGASSIYSEDFLGVQEAIINYLSHPDGGNIESMVIALKNIFGDRGLSILQDSLRDQRGRSRRISSPNIPGYRHRIGDGTEL